MNYFEAKKGESVLREYKRLTVLYWSLKPQDKRDRFDIIEGNSAPETVESIKLREQINTLFHEANYHTLQLGISTQAQSFTPPAVGGPVIPVNILESVLEDQLGHARLPRRRIMDTLDQAIGAATLVKREAFKRLLFPWYWIIDLPAFLLRIPFIILVKAGLPSKIEGNLTSQMLKVVLLLILVIILSYLSLPEKYVEIFRLLKYRNY